MSGGRITAASYATGAACTSAGSPLMGGASCTLCAGAGPLGTGPPGATGTGGASFGIVDSARGSGAGGARGVVYVAAGSIRGTVGGGPVGGAPVAATGVIPRDVPGCR